MGDRSHVRKKNAGGRPKKIPHVRPNSGRKQVGIKNASKSTRYRRALNILKISENDPTVLQSAINICQKREIIEPENSSDDEHEDKFKKIIKHTKESALAFYLENNYNQKSYKALVSDSIARNCKLYPCYQKVREAMVQCELEKNEYHLSEIEISVTLQQILNKSAERLCDAVATEWDGRYVRNLELSVTLGFDSSSAHLNPHQKCVDPKNERSDPQSSLFVSSFIIVQLRSNSSTHSWLNPTPQSVRFCRPLRLAFEKEDEAATLKEHTRITKEIDALATHTFHLKNGIQAEVTFVVSQTLFDGKCVNTIVGNRATCRCPMCNRTVHNFGNLEDDFAPTESFLKLGMGLLHCEIKSFEHILHLAYRNTESIKTWDIKKPLKGKIVSVSFENLHIIIYNLMKGIRKILT